MGSAGELTELSLHSGFSGKQTIKQTSLSKDAGRESDTSTETESLNGFGIACAVPNRRAETKNKTCTSKTFSLENCMIAKVL